MLTAVQTTLESVGTVEPALLQTRATVTRADRIHVSEALTGYVLDLARASREHGPVVSRLVRHVEHCR